MKKDGQGWKRMEKDGKGPGQRNGAMCRQVEVGHPVPFHLLKPISHDLLHSVGMWKP